MKKKRVKETMKRKEVLAQEDLNKISEDRIIDNLNRIADLLILCDGDIRTNKKLDKKFGNKIYEITNQLINLGQEMQKEKNCEEECAYKELIKFCKKAYFTSPAVGPYFPESVHWNLEE